PSRDTALLDERRSNHRPSRAGRGVRQAVARALGGGGDARIVECRFKAVTSKRLAVRPLFLQALAPRSGLNANLGWRHPASNRRGRASRVRWRVMTAVQVVPVRCI